MARAPDRRKPRRASTDRINAARDSAALAAALDPIVTIDAKGTIQSASDSVTRVLGWLPGELIGRNVSVLMPEPHHSAHDGYLARYHRTGQTNIMNRPRRFEARRKDGSLLPIELCVSRADIPGAPLFVGIIRDMSSYAEAERTREQERVLSQELLAQQTAALQTAHLRLRMADRMASIGTLAAGLGHDMNNVLLPVRARLNALRSACDSGTVPESERRHIDEIRKSVAYLQQLADGLHFLALDPDADEGRADSEQSTDLREWWSQVGAMIAKAVPKHVKVVASIAGTLPRVRVAPHRLTQAVLNLVVNAGEAIPTPVARKRKQGYVRLGAQECRLAGRAAVRLVVADNGAGMTEEVKRRAFEMFYTTKPRGLGTGLGLALVRRVTEQAGGTVALDSEPGKGTSITMTIPVAQSADQAGPEASVSVHDGRSAALIAHMLTAAGAQLRPEPPKGRGLWVVEPGAVEFAAAQRWRKAGPDRALVAFGLPGDRSAARWANLCDITIERRDDLRQIQDALSRAISAC